MKYSVVLVLIAGCLVAGVSQGESLRDLPVVLGNYQVMSESALQTQRASSSQRIGPLEERVPPNRLASDTSQVVVPGAVLRNRNTGKAAVATGQLAVITTPEINIYKLAHDHGLTVSRSVPSMNLYVLAATGDQDLVALQQTLSSDPDVKSVKVDIKENTRKPM